jgi:hypothetical protein
MTGAELRAMRRKLHMTKFDFGRLLGYTAKRNSLVVHIHRMEIGRKPLPLYIARLAWLIDQLYERNLARSIGETPIPLQFDQRLLPLWPAWPYKFEDDEEAPGPPPAMML